MLSWLHDRIDKDGGELWDIAFQETEIPYTLYSFQPKEKINILLTMTTCKRFELFQKTVNSIVHMWLDLDKVDAWFCVDDNSSEEDRTSMKTLYPWIDYYMKTPSEKGHRTSMNIIWNKLKEIKPTYWIHMEDDFVFHVSKTYVRDAIRGLEELQVDQLLFNRNYAETIHDYKIKGHVGEGEFCKHEYKTESVPYRNCHYWPHYSFRPSLIKVDTILSLGNFDSPNLFFEMDYAHRWMNAGFRSGFFNKITCQHVGKLTNDTSKPNAYQLNHCDQFSPFVKVINLERRKDRRDHMQNILPVHHEFVNAVDGKILSPTKDLKRLFEGNDFGSRKGVIGCAMSHYQLWKKLLTDTKEYYFIMEDDVEICDKFVQKLDVLDDAMKKNDVCFLGYHVRSKDKIEYTGDVTIHPLQKEIYVGGTFAYSINKKGAQKMIDYIETNGIKHGIDYVMKISPLECVECRPPLVFSDWNENGKLIDTDIQQNYDSMNWDYIFIKGVDHCGDDIPANSKYSVGFNTLGFVKSYINVHQLKPSPYFKEQDGIYINKEYHDMQQLIRVKMLCNWCSSEQLCKEWSNMCESKFIWKHIQMTWQDDVDYYVVINSTNEFHDPAKTIVFQMEPWVYDMTKPWGVKTWGKWAKPTGYLHVHAHENHLNAVQWLLEQTYKELCEKSIEKSKQLSTIVSSKYRDDGHILRLDFLKYLESRMNIDIYGRDTYPSVNYKGRLDKKSNGLMPYKYYYMMENNFEKNYITEKLFEPILCESLCFYYGCPNVSDYIDPKAFVQLDKDFEKSYQIIQTAIREDWYTQRLPFIRKAKYDILHRMSFFPTLNHIIESKKQTNPFTEKYKRVCFLHCPDKVDTVDLIVKHVDKVFIMSVEPIQINHDKIQVIPLKYKYSFELETINWMRTFSENQDCDVLYADNNIDVSLLEHVDKLHLYDTVGYKIVDGNRPYYIGNVWSKTSYLRTLNYVSYVSRDDAIGWMLSNHQCKSYEIKIK
jgi:GR25 family glycosyltransferase involved in LPS biosynthesis